jgi:hypothetical protein
METKKFHSAFHPGAGPAAVALTQSAERIFRRVAVRLAVEKGLELDPLMAGAHFSVGGFIWFSRGL